jgi:hypothetical protein
MGRPGSAAVAGAATATTTERLAKFAAETAAIPAVEQGKVGAAVQLAAGAGLVAAPMAGAVAAGKFLTEHSAMKSVEAAERERRKKRREQGLPEQP